MFDSAAFGVRVSAPAGVGASSLTDGELFDRVIGLEQARARLDAEECAILAELHTRDATDRHHGLRTKGWLSRKRACHRIPLECACRSRARCGGCSIKPRRRWRTGGSGSTTPRSWRERATLGSKPRSPRCKRCC
ncbi:MAG: hypothetical protein R2698_01545 [Microthrixaceae bacterium]